jgi:hypothetical protein
MKTGYSRTHVKCCKLVVSDAYDLGNMVHCILTSKNQIYSRCNFTTKIEFTSSKLVHPNALFSFHHNLIYHILTSTIQQCSIYGGQHLAVFCLIHSLINFRKLSFRVKILLSAIKQKIISFLEVQVDHSNISDYNEYRFEV